MEFSWKLASIRRLRTARLRFLPGSQSSQRSPKAAHDTFTAQQAVYLVSQHAGIAIFAEPPSLTRHEGVVIRPLTDKSLCFETCLILRADQDSRAVNEYARSFLKKYAPQRVAAKRMDLPLLEPLGCCRAISLKSLLPERPGVSSSGRHDQETV
jgi:hypothetical protein